MIELDLKQYIDELGVLGEMSLDQLPQTRIAFDQGVEGIRNYWAAVVTGTIPVPGIKPRFQKEYQDALYQDGSLRFEFGADSMSATIAAIKGQLSSIPVAFFEGTIPAFDMKPGILRGPNAIRYDKKGRIYKNVPFRFSPDNKLFQKLPDELHVIMKDKAPHKAMVIVNPASITKTTIRKLMKDGTIETKVVGFKTTHQGERLTMPEIPEHLRVNGKSKYEGMVRIEKDYESDTQNMFMTWRRVSADSPPNSFWHRGFQANPISEHVKEWAKEKIVLMIREGLERDIRQIFGGGAQ